MPLFVAVHSHEYGKTAYLFSYSYKGDQPTPPSDQALADLLKEQNVNVPFSPELDHSLVAVQVRNPEFNK